jgi:hypothetical protein
MFFNIEISNHWSQIDFAIQFMMNTYGASSSGSGDEKGIMIDTKLIWLVV